MPWEAFFNDQLVCVELIYREQVSQKELFDAFFKASELAIKHSTIRFLADCTALTGGYTIADLFELINKYSSGGVHIRFREAVILPVNGKIVDDAEFYETACLNRGFDVKLFQTREDAITWLCKQNHLMS